MGSFATSVCVPSVASCSCAAGRLTSSDAIRTFLRSFSFRRLAILAVVVVLPEPCKPAIITMAGGVTSIISSDVSEPSISVRPSLTIRSEEHTSELQSLMRISYAVLCLKKKKHHYYTNKQLNPHLQSRKKTRTHTRHKLYKCISYS